MLTETIKSSPVKLTESAARQVSKIVSQESIPEDQFLRVAVKGGGCAGMSYELGFDHKTDMDEVAESENVTIIIDKRHILYLEGIEIDFAEGLDNRGFIFNNPQATSTCGCGTSFSA